MELSGNYFIYSGISSRTYGLVFANGTTTRTTRLSGSIESMTVHNNKEHRNYYIGESFDESALLFDIEVITDDDHVLDVAECREIEKWLFRKNGYRKLYIDSDCDFVGETYELVDGELKQLYLNCRFVNPEKIESRGGTVGFKFTVECDSSMAWQDPITCMFSFSDHNSGSDNIVSVNVDTDLQDYVYPKVRITVGGEGGDIAITNESDDETRITSFVGLSPNIVLTMRGYDSNYISGDNYKKFSSRNFIRLLDGVNNIAILGDIAEIEFEFQNQRYI